ncbi:MAG: hypothetical protein JNN04_04970 [Cyclobacteriaceae bacterium]|nr:hypothetical protein [Cyclobacteriaceae bacterium]
MKTKYTMMAAFLAFAGTAGAQEVDDMYFTARDRAQHNELTNATLAMRYAAEDQQAAKSNPVNPSDTYTGRGVNPEFSAQQKNGAEIIQGNPDYFLASFKPKDINSSLYSGSSISRNNCACSPYSSMAYGGFGNPYGSFYSPYGFYSPYMGYPGMYGPSTMLGYSMSPYGSMWSLGMSYGMGSMYGSPYYSMYNPYGYGYGYGYGYPYAPVMGYDPVQTVSGRRPVRASTVNSSFPTNTAGYVASGTNGRSRSTRTDYYDPQWRNDPNNFPTRSYSYGGRNTGFDNNGSTGRTWMGSDSYGTRSRSSFDSFGSTGRSSMGGFSGGSSGGSSGGGGRSRGRN